MYTPERGETVQLVTAVVRPGKVNEICEAMQAFGFRGLTVTEAAGFGKQRGHAEVYRGAEYLPDFQPTTRVEIVVPDEDVRDVIDVICKVAATGHIGDGKIWVTDVRHVVRIRTREADGDAV
jgi:nitrogen regulatory protein P-II 1